MDNRLKRAVWDFGSLNLSELSAAGWLLFLATTGAVVATGVVVVPMIEQAGVPIVLRDDTGKCVAGPAAAKLCLGAGIATFVGGRALFWALGVSCKRTPRFHQAAGDQRTP